MACVRGVHVREVLRVPHHCPALGCHHQHSWVQIVLFETADLYRRAAEFDDLRFKSNLLEGEVGTICTSQLVRTACTSHIVTSTFQLVTVNNKLTILWGS